MVEDLKMGIKVTESSHHLASVEMNSFPCTSFPGPKVGSDQYRDMGFNEIILSIKGDCSGQGKDAIEGIQREAYGVLFEFDVYRNFVRR